MNVIWIGMYLALEALRHGVILMGAPGTGKSLLLKAFRMELARLMRRSRTLRLHVLDFDTKGDLLEVHAAVPPDCPVYDLNPFVEADVYAVMEELEDPRDIYELAALCVDVDANESQKFFPLGARSIKADLDTRHWLVCPGEARFADLVNTCNAATRMRLVAASHPTTAPLLALLQDNEVGMSLIATLAMEMKKLAIPAALYQSNTTGRPVSSKVVEGWRSITRLAFDLKSVETLAPLTRLFILRAQQRVLSTIERDRLVVLILDELALLPGGVDLSTGAIFGRESGWCPILSFQSLKSAEKAWGKAKLEATLSTAKTFIAFHLPDPADAEAAAKRFASFTGIVRSDHESWTTGPNGRTTTAGWSESVQEVPNVTAGMIQALNVPAPGKPYLEYYMVTVGTRPVYHKVRIPEFVEQFLGDLTPVEKPPRRAARDMVLQPWTAADLKRLKLDAAVSPATPTRPLKKGQGAL